MGVHDVRGPDGPRQRRRDRARRMAAEIAERSDDADRQGAIPVRPGFRSERHELTRDMLCEGARQLEWVPLAPAEQALPCRMQWERRG